jgi:L-alanine-DL-glutamate epimerase-like enolase superfamily enzyme
MIIALEGIDASGKATQSKLLAEKLRGTRFAFPDYETPAGEAILGHLKKEWIAVRKHWQDAFLYDPKTNTAQRGEFVHRFDDKLNATIARVVTLPEVKKQFEEQGTEGASSSQADMAKLLRDDYARLRLARPDPSDVETVTPVERVRLIRQTVGPGVALMLDANGGWDLQTAKRAAQLFEPLDIFWLEDPMPWYDERGSLARLKAATAIPIAAGETEYTPFGLRTMLAEGLVDYLIIDSTWAGGLTTWKKAAVVAELYQVPLAAHHDPQIHVHAVAASPTGFILESFADPTRDPLWFELFRARPEIVDGYMAVPDEPGLGLELRQDTLEKYGVRIE